MAGVLTGGRSSLSSASAFTGAAGLVLCETD
jgi:hypothetical protein